MEPTWGLTLAYWLHMLATVVWVGCLVTLSVLVLPSAEKVLSESYYVALRSRVIQRLDVLAWFSLVVLFGTGMFQMSAHPNYEGFLSIQSTWAAAILIKHLVISGMVGVSAYLTWGVLPGLRRLALLQAAGKKAPEQESRRLNKSSSRLLAANLALALLVLALTALARVS
jgi:uncharacterized membrane protein